jgi:quercetin dioxygenase-like cupin family protein
MHLFPRKAKATPNSYYFGEFDDNPLAPFSISLAHFKQSSYTTEAKHYHTHNQKVFITLSGEAVLEVNGEEVTLTPENMIQVEPGEIHRVLRIVSQEVSFIVVLAKKENDKVIVN